MQVPAVTCIKGTEAKSRQSPDKYLITSPPAPSKVNKDKDEEPKNDVIERRYDVGNTTILF